MMTVHFKAIEDTFLTMERRYGIELTNGLESFLVLVFNRIFKDQRLWERCSDSPWADIPFREEIFMEACKEEFPAYQGGALEKECQKRNIPFLEETELIFQKTRARLDREAQKKTERAENQIRAEYRMGVTPYQADAPGEELMRRGKWYLLQTALREWDNDDEGIFYCSERMFQRSIIYPKNVEENAFFYAIELAEAGWEVSVRKERRRYIRAEAYDAFIRELIEPCGLAQFCRGKYVLKINGTQACKAALGKITERWEALAQQKEIKYPDVRAVYYDIMKDCLRKVADIFYWLQKEEYGNTWELAVFGPYCLHEEAPDDCCPIAEHPYLHRLPRNMQADGQGITYEEYKDLISRIEEQYFITLHSGDEEEHMKLLEEENILHPIDKSFMETVWCHSIIHTPQEEYQGIRGALDRRILLDMIRAVYPVYENGKLKEACDEYGIFLPEIFRRLLKVEEPKMSKLYMNHEKLVQNGRKRLWKEIQDWCNGFPADPEAEFLMTYYGLMTSAPITEGFPRESDKYYVMEPILYIKDERKHFPAHRLYLMDCTYDALMREFFEDTTGYRMSGDKYHLTISREEMEFLIEKRIRREIQDAENFINDSECGEDELILYETIRQIWVRFIDFVQRVYLDYGTGRPEMALYGPYNLQKEGIPPEYRQFLLECLK